MSINSTYIPWKLKNLEAALNFMTNEISHKAAESKFSGYCESLSNQETYMQTIILYLKFRTSNSGGQKLVTTSTRKEGDTGSYRGGWYTLYLYGALRVYSLLLGIWRHLISKRVFCGRGLKNGWNKNSYIKSPTIKITKYLLRELLRSN